MGSCELEGRMHSQGNTLCHSGVEELGKEGGRGQMWFSNKWGNSDVIVGQSEWRMEFELRNANRKDLWGIESAHSQCTFLCPPWDRVRGQHRAGRPVWGLCSSVLTFVLQISFCAVFSVLGRMSPRGRGTALPGRWLLSLQAIASLNPGPQGKVLGCAPSLGRWLAVPSRIFQNADSLEDGTWRSFGNPTLHIFDRWPSSLDLSTCKNREHTTSQCNCSNFGLFLAGYSFISRKKNLSPSNFHWFYLELHRIHSTAFWQDSIPIHKHL